MKIYERERKGREKEREEKRRQFSQNQQKEANLFCCGNIVVIDHRSFFPHIYLSTVINAERAAIRQHPIFAKKIERTRKEILLSLYNQFCKKTKTNRLSTKREDK
jgi:hypothetical protein